MIIVPDLHGRKKLLDSVLAAREENEKVIFLGDYVDPYGYEGYTRQDAVDCLEAVIKLKKEFPENIVLLLGNHDCNYSIPNYPRELKSRYDYGNGVQASTAPALKTLFNINHDLFQIGHVEKIGERNFIFSHSGLTEGWIKAGSEFFGGETDPLSIVGIINRAWKRESQELFDLMEHVGRSRGGYARYGSIVWADMTEHSEKHGDPESAIFQIFGHTQLVKDEPVVWNTWACLDCRRAFRLNDNGEITDLTNSDIIFKSVEQEND